MSDGEISGYFHILGDMHDVSLDNIVITLEAKRVEINLSNVFINYEGESYYPGNINGTIEFFGILNMVFSGENIALKKIYEASIIRYEHHLTTIFKFYPAGSLIIESKTAEFSKEVVEYLNKFPELIKE
jgi:hypothetical protein